MNLSCSSQEECSHARNLSLVLVQNYGIFEAFQHEKGSQVTLGVNNWTDSYSHKSWEAEVIISILFQHGNWF